MKFRKLSKKVGLFLVIAAMCSAASAQTPRQERLLNGLKVLMWPDKTSGDVTVRLRIHSGAAFDQQGKEGTMQLLADNLFPNAAAKEFFVEDLGGSLDVVTTYDYIQINTSSKPDQLLTMLETLSSAVANPQFEKETTAQIQAALLARLKALGADPAYVADQAAASRLLGTFPYGRPISGTPESVKKLVTADLIEARQRFLAADNATIAVSGNFDRSLAFKALRRYFGSWMKSDRKVPSTFQQPSVPPTDVMIVASPTQGTTEIRAAIRSSARGAKDFASSQVFAKVLENRLKARVPASGASAVSVRNQTHVQPGILLIALPWATSVAKADADEIVTKALQDPITEAEFQSARGAAAQIAAGRPVEEFWLDADTYRIASAEADRNAIGKATLGDVRSFADRVRMNPVATVLVTTPDK